MRDAFGVVLFVVVGVSAVGAVLALLATNRTYEDIGKGGLHRDGDARSDAGTPTGVRDDEIRQMLIARNARRTARGDAATDVERELVELTRPAHDPALEAEVRELVEARNRRLVAKGRPPLDVGAEVARRLRELR
jgi:hypothetical protein